MNTEERILPFLKSFQDTFALCQGEYDEFCLDALLIHAWLGELLVEAGEMYAERANRKCPPMQTGKAQRGFLRIFGNPNDTELHRLLQSMYRFTECYDPIAAILFRALVPLSLEHDSSGDFAGPRSPDFNQRPRQAVLWMRESLERWCDWIDAVIHFQTHAQWHLAPECFDPNPEKRQSVARAINQRYLAQMRGTRKADWRAHHFGATHRFMELPTWQILPQPMISQPQRPWPHPELDEAIISLWPLVKRHNWSYGDLLTILGDLFNCSDAFLCQSERNLAMYSTQSLRLRKTGYGKTVRNERPPGYLVALRLFPPAEPLPAAPMVFGEIDPNAVPQSAA